MDFKEGYSVKFKDNVTKDMLSVLKIPGPTVESLLSKTHIVYEEYRNKIRVKGFSSYWIDSDLFELVTVQQDSLRKRLNDVLGKNDPHVASYALRGVDANGVVLDKLQAQDICHARLVTPFDWVKVTDVALHVKNYFTRDHFTDEQADAYKEYISWVINHSPWAMAFKTKHVWVATRYGIEMDVSVAHNIVVAAAIAIRLGSEYVNFSLNWKRFKKEGLTPEQAFLLASFTSVKTAYDPTVELHLNLHQGGHHVVSATQSFKGLVKFLEKGYSDKTKKGITLLQGSKRYNILDPITTDVVAEGTVSQVLSSLPAYQVVGADVWGNPKRSVIGTKSFIKQFQEAYNAAI